MQAGQLFALAVTIEPYSLTAAGEDLAMGESANLNLQFWPLVMGWIIVSIVALFGWRRQALIAAAGMTIVTGFVFGKATGLL